MEKNVDYKVSILLEEYGYEDATDLLAEFMFESTAPAICMTPGCDATYEYEPDQDRGFCEECRNNSVKSIYILLGYM